MKRKLFPRKSQFRVDTYVLHCTVLRISYNIHSPLAYKINNTRGLFKANGTELFPWDVQVAYPKLPESWINWHS